MDTAKKGFRQAPQPTKAQQQTRSALQRIDMLEEAHQQIIEGVNQVFSNSTKRLVMLEKAMGAVIEAIGIEQVQNILNIKAKQEQDNRDASLKALITKSLEDKLIEPAEVIAEDSLIVGAEFDSKGEQIGGRAQLSYSEVAPEFQTELLGKGVGTDIVTKPKNEDGTVLPEGRFNVLEIYKVLPKKEEPPVAEVPNETPAAEPPVVQ